MLVHFDELAVVSFLETLLAMRQVQDQCRQKFGLCLVGQQCRVQRVLFTETGTADAVDDHDRSLDVCICKPVERIDGRLVRFAFVDAFEDIVVAGFGTDIDLFQTGSAQRPQLLVRLAGDVARRAVGCDPRDFRQIFPNHIQDGQQPFCRECHDIAIGQKHAPDIGIMPAEPFDFLFDIFFRLDREAFLGLGVHIAIGTFVPAASIGDLQDEGIGFAWRSENGIDIADGNVLHGTKDGLKRASLYHCVFLSGA